MRASGWVDAFLSSSASPRSSGRHTGKPPELCTSERPEGDKSPAGLISLTRLKSVKMQGCETRIDTKQVSDTPAAGTSLKPLKHLRSSCTGFVHVETAVILITNDRMKKNAKQDQVSLSAME